MRIPDRLRHSLFLSAAALAGLIWSCPPLHAEVQSFAYDGPGNLTSISSTNTLGPSITAQPAPQLFQTSAPVTLSVVAAGPGLAFQWLVNGSPILGATGDTLVLTNPAPFASNSFSVIISNVSGVVTSTPAMLWLDSNANGIPDWWEMKYFGNLNQPAAGDFDHDGVSNLDEYLEGTNPTNSLSFNPRLSIQTSRGRVFASPDLPYYTNGQNVILSTIPDTGNLFLGWSGSVTSSVSPLSLVMTNHKTILATFGVPLPIALDNTNLNWTNVSGYIPWFGQADVSFDGVSAAQSGIAADGQQARLQTATNLAQPMQLNFYWSVSSQAPDGLYFYIDTVQKASFSGTGGGWQRFQTSLAAGPHTFLWLYAKDSGDVANGIPTIDAGWVDQVTLGFPPSFTNQPISQIATQGGDVSLNVGVFGSQPILLQWFFNNSPLAGATSPTLSLNSIQPASAGSYSVIASNLYGQATSSVVTVTVTSTNCVPPPTGLAAWWPGDGYPLDIVGGNNGSLQNGAAYAPAFVGQGFSFNGASNYFQLPDSLFPIPLSGTGTNPFSFQLWFSTTHGGVLLGQQNTLPLQTPTRYAPAIYVGNDGFLRAEMFWTGSLKPLVSLNPVNDGNFHHLAVVFDGTSETLYLDGADNGSASVIQVAQSGVIHYQLGLGFTTLWPAAPAGWYACNGLIDEPALYNRALSPAEVQATYQAGAAGMCRPVPSISTLVPASGVAGATVTIDGANFYTVTNVLFNGASANFTILSSTRLTVTIPANATSGPITLLTTAGQVAGPTSFMVLPAPTCAPMPAGLIGWWAGEGNAKDFFGTHNGTNQGGVSFTAGKVGQAFSFNGTNAYVDLGNWFNLQTFTICCWLKPAAVQTSNANIIDNNQSTNSSWSLGDEGTALTFDWGELWAPGEEGLISVTLVSNVWQHLAITVDSNFVNRLYLNTELIGSFQQRPIYYDGTQFLRLGRWGGGGRFFNGLIDELCIFNRALSPDEISAIYTADSAGLCQFSFAFDTSPAGLKWTSNGLQMTLLGLTGHGPVVIYSSTDLLSWVPVYTNPPAVGSIQFLDTSATNYAGRFYRALQQ